MTRYEPQGYRLIDPCEKACFDADLVREEENSALSLESVPEELRDQHGGIAVEQSCFSLLCLILPYFCSFLHPNVSRGSISGP